jgi:hypothetical protein
MATYVTLQVATLEWLSDDYYYLSEHYALLKRYYEGSMSRDAYVQCMEAHIKAGLVEVFLGDMQNPVTTDLGAIGGIDNYLTNALLEGPFVSITESGESYLASVANPS